MPLHPNPFAVQQAAALILIAIVVGIGVICHDWYEKTRKRGRGPWR